MSFLLILEQILNGLQLGVMLFLMAAGLTLVLGIMNLVNLAHGSLYMVGAFVAATVSGWTGSFLLGLLAALPAAALTGLVVEVIALRALYERSHLDQVLATFGLILFFNELAKIVWGPRALFLDGPSWLAGAVEIIPGAPYPAFRLAIIVVGIAVAVFLYFLTTKTKLGMLIRAGASNREMVWRPWASTSPGSIRQRLRVWGPCLAGPGRRPCRPHLRRRGGYGGAIC